jgi:hypothetical protein
VSSKLIFGTAQSQSLNVCRRYAGATFPSPHSYRRGDYLKSRTAAINSINSGVRPGANSSGRSGRAVAGAPSGGSSVVSSSKPSLAGDDPRNIFPSSESSSQKWCCFRCTPRSISFSTSGYCVASKFGIGNTLQCTLADSLSLGNHLSYIALTQMSGRTVFTGKEKTFRYSGPIMHSFSLLPYRWRRRVSSLPQSFHTLLRGLVFLRREHDLIRRFLATQNQASHLTAYQAVT